MNDFNPALLKLAREARGWPQTTLAEAAKVGQGSVSKYEKGLMEPSRRQAGALARALEMPLGFFLQPEVRPAAVLYRSRVLKSARREATVRARLNLARLVALRLLEDVDVESEARFPGGDREFSSPEQAAAELRAGWWLPPGPIASVTEAIESAGAVVLRLDLGCDEVDAAYLHPLSDRTRWFFINTRVHAGDRVRFSLAHELGHAVLHEVDFVPDTKQAEDQSNSFSGAFMLPSDELRADLPRGRLRVAHLVELKRRWGMSMGAIAMRAHHIGAISRNDLTALWKEIGWRGYRTQEPVDVPVERPMIFDAALNIHRTEHRMSDDDLAGMAHVSRVVLAELFPEHFAPPVRRGHLSVVSARKDRVA
jgi:Zn-dependent peptidase ImmA (M78 family)/DNA-binding XRE family transcriptional regulator